MTKTGRDRKARERVEVPLWTGQPSTGGCGHQDKTGWAGPGRVSEPGLSPGHAEAIGRVIERGAQVYRRDVMLPRLLPVGPADIADRTPSGRLRILKRLAKALRSERTRGRAGHWSYSLNRHIGLLQAFAAERAAYRAGRDAGAR